jgi:crossover junction endodeoxyribonuclease RuvC
LKILGIDPGLSTTGYGIIEAKGDKLREITHGTIKKRRKTDFAQKLLGIYQGVTKIIQEYQPDYCAIESIFYHQNKKTAITMGHVRGVAILAAAQSQIAVAEYSPREIKLSIVGSGGAAKIQIQAMVKNILKLTEIPHSEDAADALAVAICHFHRLNFTNRIQY